ncbi:hypothetical protein Q4100_06350 [Acinetobacter baumannii]
MKTLRLTDSEYEYIIQEREKVHHKKEEERFRKRVFATALEYSQYLEEEKIGSGFNEFINCFNPPHEPIKNKIEFNAVEQILETVKSLKLPVLKKNS